MSEAHMSGPLIVGGRDVSVGSGGLSAYRKTYWVDGKRGNNENSGLGVNEAYKTVTRALALVQDEDLILIMKGTGNYDEKLATGQNIRHAALVAGRGRNVTIAGATTTNLPYNSPQLYNVSGSEYSLFIRSPGWRVTGLRIVGDSGAPRCIVAEMAQAGNTADTNWAPGLQIDHCVIYGYVGSASGFTSQAIGDCRIHDNLFEGFATGSLPAFGMEGNGSIVTIPGFTFPTFHILRNHFTDNAQNIVVSAQRSEIAYNSIGRNRNNALGSFGGIDLNGGSGDNIIFMNTLAGQWESGGQYRVAAASDDWSGNIIQGGVVNGVINPPWTSSAPNA